MISQVVTDRTLAAPLNPTASNIGTMIAFTATYGQNKDSDMNVRGVRLHLPSKLASAPIAAIPIMTAAPRSGSCIANLSEAPPHPAREGRRATPGLFVQVDQFEQVADPGRIAHSLQRGEVLHEFERGQVRIDAEILRQITEPASDRIGRTAMSSPRNRIWPRAGSKINDRLTKALKRYSSGVACAANFLILL
jgi:hypothetical protein